VEQYAAGESAITVPGMAGLAVHSVAMRLTVQPADNLPHCFRAAGRPHSGTRE
jgi:hypothetical protein